MLSALAAIQVFAFYRYATTLIYQMPSGENPRSNDMKKHSDKIMGSILALTLAFALHAVVLG